MCIMNYASVFLAKHSLQYTGLPSVGLKGTLQLFPHSAQVASCISLGALDACFFASRQALQRCGSFTKPFSSFYSCSPAVKINSLWQSLHTNVLSSYMFHPTSLKFCLGAIIQKATPSSFLRIRCMALSIAFVFLSSFSAISLYEHPTM